MLQSFLEAKDDYENSEDLGEAAATVPMRRENDASLIRKKAAKSLPRRIIEKATSFRSFKSEDHTESDQKKLKESAKMEEPGVTSKGPQNHWKKVATLAADGELQSKLRKWKESADNSGN